MDRRLAGLPAGPFDLSPRFYPPGQHPATRRMGEVLKQCRELRPKLVSGGIDTANIEAQIEYLETRMAAFEEVESECKQRTLAMIERRERRA